MRSLGALSIAVLAACGGEAEPWTGEPGIPVPAITSTAAYAGDAFLRDLLSEPFPRAIVGFIGAEEASSYTASGASNSNAEWVAGDGDLNVEGQRGAYYVIAAGIIARADDGGALLERGLRALEWGLAQQGDDGSFPLERGGTTDKDSSIHAKSTFIEAAARSLRLLRESGGIDPARLDGLASRLGVSARWLATTPDLEAFLARAKNTNQRFFAVAAIHEAARLLDDAALRARGAELLDALLALQLEDGTFVENGGFDASYQTVSLDLLTQIAATEDDPATRARALDAARRAADRFLRVVRDDGTIDDRSSTRTRACGEPRRGRGPKGKDIDVIPLRLYQLGFLEGTLPVLLPIANRIEGAGQGFDHIESCD